MTFITKVLFKNFSSKFECHVDKLSDSHTSLTNVNGFLPVSPTFHD